MSNFTLNPDENNLVYFPLKYNNPLTIDKSTYIKAQIGINSKNLKYYCDINGFLNSTDKNPSVFPYTEEWYNKLKHTYPDLEPYKKPEINYNKVMKELLDLYGHVIAVESDYSYEHATFKLGINKNTFTKLYSSIEDSIFYVPLNPFTFKPCESVKDYKLFNTDGDFYSKKYIQSSPGGFGFFDEGFMTFHSKEEEDNFREILKTTKFYFLES